MPLAANTRLGPYEIVAPLGAGGMGEVFRARDTRLDRTVAIKICTGRFTERFEREARAISSLNHPHICALYDIGCEDAVEFLVMEYLEGESLEARLRKGRCKLMKPCKSPSKSRARLDAAHRRGMVHRDLKPANVMLTKGGAKLLDFGLAKMNEPGLRIRMLLGSTRARSRSKAPSLARCNTWPPSNSKARRPTRARTSSPSAQCSTK